MPTVTAHQHTVPFTIPSADNNAWVTEGSLDLAKHPLNPLLLWWGTSTKGEWSLDTITDGIRLLDRADDGTVGLEVRDARYLFRFERKEDAALFRMFHDA